MSSVGAVHQALAGIDCHVLQVPATMTPDQASDDILTHALHLLGENPE